MNKINKYPQNILLLLIFLFICFGIIFFVKYQDSKNLSQNNTESATKNSITSQARFKLKNVAVFGSKINPLAVQEFNGTGFINVDLITGDIKVNSVELQNSLFKIEKIDKKLKVISIKLDPAYSSIGSVNLNTGKIDLSVGIVVEMNIDKNPNTEKISLVFPLVGNFNKKTGSLYLAGAVTIPPGKLQAPMPVELTVNAVNY